MYFFLKIFSRAISLYRSHIFQESFIYDRFDNSITFIHAFRFFVFLLCGYKNIKIFRALENSRKKFALISEKKKTKTVKLNLCLSTKIFEM